MFKLKIKIFSAITLFLVMIPVTTNAAGLIPCATSEHPEPCTLCHFVVGFKGLVDFGMNLITIAAIVGIFFAGIMYIISTGDQTMMEKAKGFLKSSLMGFAIFFSAWLIVYITMWALSAKTDLGIGISSWNKFTCSTKSTAPTSSTQQNNSNSPLKYACDKIDVNNNGTIDAGEGKCNADASGVYSSLGDCEAACPVAPSSRCGASNEGLCVNDLSCPLTTTLIDASGKCDASQKCCKPNL